MMTGEEIRAHRAAFDAYRHAHVKAWLDYEHAMAVAWDAYCRAHSSFSPSTIPASAPSKDANPG